MPSAAIAAELADLETREAQPKLQLSPETIVALEREKAALLAPLKEDTLLARLKAKKDVVAHLRGTEDDQPATLAPLDLETRAAWNEPATPVPPALARQEYVAPPAVAGPLTFDPLTLSALAETARFAQDTFNDAQQQYHAAQRDLQAAKGALYAYLQQSGVPVTR